MKHPFSKIKPHLALAAAGLLICNIAGAHTINYAMEAAPADRVFMFYLILGVEHIVPYGLDHILFVVGICLLNTRLKPILWQATAFTVAHSITLVLSTKGIITLPAAIVEPIIALSILFVALENIILNQLKPARIMVVFLFGLIHGLGFASALSETGLPRNRFYESIIGFNIGVEIGQILVIAVVFGLFIFPFRNKTSYKKWVVYPLSTLIALVACYWTWERVAGI